MGALNVAFFRRRVPGTKNPFEKESMGYRDYYATLSEQSSLHTWLRNNSRLKNSLSPSDSASLQKLIEQSISEKVSGLSVNYCSSYIDYHVRLLLSAVLQ